MRRMSVKIFPLALSTSAPVTADPTVELRGRILGEIITADSSEFEAARKLPSITADRRPLAIVRVKTAEDVAATVLFARERKLPLAVRSGGHSIAHLSVIDDAVVVDLSTMNRV